MHRIKSSMTKKQEKQFIYVMYFGHCSYCGCRLQTIKDMQVDHVIPRRSFDVHYPAITYDVDDLQNKKPSCRRCNHYKRARSLESFRKLLRTIHLRLEKIYIYKVAKDYNVITENQPWNGEFYFEKIAREQLPRTPGYGGCLEKVT